MRYKEQIFRKVANQKKLQVVQPWVKYSFIEIANNLQKNVVLQHWAFFWPSFPFSFIFSCKWQSLVIWNSFVRINGNIWHLSIHVWTTLMLSQAKLDIWLPRVYEDDGDCAGGVFLEQDHQHHRHDQHIWHLNVSQGWHTELHPTHLIRVASHLVVWNKIEEDTPHQLSMIGDKNYREIANPLVFGFVFHLVFCLCITICISICVL